MQFVFSSEEFPEYATGAFQDFVGARIKDTQVEILLGNGDIDPNNLNAGTAENLFIDNTSDQYNTEMDGFPATLTLTIPVNAGDTNSIRIAANTFGRHRTLFLSPLHRLLIHDGPSEILFGERDVLVAARDLVNDQSVRRTEVGTVTCVHILFDRHQVVYSEGLETVSFLSGPQITRSFVAEIVAEIYTLFPEIDPSTGAGYGPAARPCLKPCEAQLLLYNRAEAA
jgi:hypothetical protein